MKPMHPGYWNHINGWLLVLPAVFMISLFTHFPIGSNLFHSLFSMGTVTRPATFIGLENYAVMMKDMEFWQSLTNTFYLVIFVVPISLVLSLLFANFLNNIEKLKSFFRSVYFIPTVTYLQSTDRVGQLLPGKDRTRSNGLAGRKQRDFPTSFC